MPRTQTRTLLAAFTLTAAACTQDVLLGRLPESATPAATTPAPIDCAPADCAAPESDGAGSEANCGERPQGGELWYCALTDNQCRPQRLLCPVPTQGHTQ